MPERKKKGGRPKTFAPDIHKQKHPFGVIYAPISASALSPTAKVVYAHLTRRSGTKRFCYPSYKDIMVCCNLARPTVAAALRDLVDANVLYVENRFTDDGRRRSNRYYMVHPDVWELPPGRYPQEKKRPAGPEDLTAEQIQNLHKKRKLIAKPIAGDESTNGEWKKQFEELWACLPRNRSPETKEACKKRFRYLSLDDKKAALISARFLRKYYDRASKERREFFPGPNTFFKERQWGAEYEEVWKDRSRARKKGPKGKSKHDQMIGYD